MRTLLAKEGVNAAARTRFGDFPLLSAVNHDHISIVRLLLGRDEVCRDGDSYFLPLDRAVQKLTLGKPVTEETTLEKTAREMITILTEAFYASTHESHSLDSWPPVADLLGEAVQSNDIARTELLLSRPTVHVGTPWRGKLPLDWAIENHDATITRMLLNAPFIDPNGHVQSNPPLALAIKSGDIDIIRMLLDHPKLNPNEKNFLSSTALHLAVQEGNVEIVRTLLRHPNTDPNALDQNSWTPLHFAVKKDSLEIIQLLLELPSIDLSIANLNSSQTPLQMAVETRNIDILRVLLKHRL